MGNQKKSREPSQRQLKVGEEIKQAISSALIRGDFYDPATRKSIQLTVTEVRISPDLRNATAFVTPFINTEKESTVKAMNSLVPQFRSVIAKTVKMKYVPQIHFKLDEVHEKTSTLEEIFNRPDVRKDIDKENSENPDENSDENAAAPEETK